MNYLTKRGAAYLIDILLISLIAIIFMNIIPIKTNNTDTLIDNLYEDRINNKVSSDDFIDEYAKLIREKDMSNIGMVLLNITLIFIFFIIIPFYRKQTIGQRILKLKLEGEVTFINLIKRNIIVNALLYLPISLLLLLINQYLIILTIIGIIQIIVVIKSLFMVIYRKDNCGLQDLFSKTQVVEII